MKRITAAVAVLMALAGPAMAAEDTTPGDDLGGYDASASAVAVSFQPVLPALVSTGDVPFEGSVALSNSRIKSGGNAFGRGALVWPGATAADFGPVIGVAFGMPEVGSLVPKWPAQAEATQRDGEVVTGVPPAIVMTAFGGPDRAKGDSRIVDLHTPRLVHIEHIASTAESIVTDGGVTSTAIVKLQGVSLLAGFIKAEEIRSISRTASIGSAASSSGDVDIIGLKIGGVDVSVTDDGFAVTGLPPDASQMPGGGGEAFPGQSPEEAVNSILGSLGAKITLFKSISKVSGGSAERMQPGVVLSLNNPVGGQGPIPPGRFDIFLGSTAASSLGTLPFSGGDVLGGGDGSGIGDTDPSSRAGSSTSASDGSISIGGGAGVGVDSLSDVGESLTEAAQGSLGPVGTLDDAMQRSDYRFGGIPLGLVIGLILFALFVARAIRNAYAGLLAGPVTEEGETT